MRRLWAWTVRRWPLVWKSTYQETNQSLTAAIQTIGVMAGELDAAMETQISPFVGQIVAAPGLKWRVFRGERKEIKSYARIEVLREVAFTINRDICDVLNVTQSHAVFRKHAYEAARRLMIEASEQAARQLTDRLLAARMELNNQFKGRQHGTEAAGRGSVSERGLEEAGPKGVSDLAPVEAAGGGPSRSGAAAKARPRSTARKRTRKARSAKGADRK